MIGLLKKIIYWLKKLFVQNVKQEASSAKEIIGSARFDNKVYFFLREGKRLFLVSDTVHRVYRREIFFSTVLRSHIPNMRDLDATLLKNGQFALVMTVAVKNKYKTIYLLSEHGIQFKAESMVESPNGYATKIVEQRNGDVALITSLHGEICYRKLDLSDRDIEYHSTSLSPRNDSFDHSPLRIVGTFVIPDGIFVLYDASYEMRGFKTHRFGAALIDHDNLGHIHWRAFFDEVPFWDYFASQSSVGITASAIGAYLNEDMIKVYFYDDRAKDIYTLDLHEPYSRRNPHPEKAMLKKYVNNPILAPHPHNDWENHTTFNPTAIQIDSTTHLLYRAEGSAGLSVIGYGKSHNGIVFDRLTHPIYVPTMNFEGVNIDSRIIQTFKKGRYKSGYNYYPSNYLDSHIWHGVEDPRITEIEGRLYIVYAAYNGYQQARPAITSISKNDFLNAKWNWKTPQPMTDIATYHGQGNKNVVLHPEKVRGKYMLFHRIWPHIRIDYVDTLDFGPGKKYLKEMACIKARGDSWDSHKIAIAAAPIRIDEGWLVIYQGAGSNDRRYKVGAMILDYENPEKVLYRSNYPIMAPSQWYENEHKFGVAYPCGAVVREGVLCVYYGGSDKYVCLAQAPLREFVDKLKKDPYIEPELTKIKNIDDLCI